MPSYFPLLNESFLVFQKLLDPVLAFSEWESCSTQPLLQLIRMALHLLSQFIQSKPIHLYNASLPTVSSGQSNGI